MNEALETLDEEQRLQWIAHARPYDLLFIWRFGASTNPIFHGEAGKAYAARFAALREELGPEKWSTLSKAVGWRNES